MAEEQGAATAVEAAKRGPKKTAGAAKAARKVTNHPSSADMVLEAVGQLAEKGGSSLQAIKKHIAAAHLIDMDKHRSYVNKAIKRLVETGKLVQPKGTGASGSFKLAPKEKAAVKKTTSSAAAAEKKKKPQVKKAAATAPSKAKKITTTVAGKSKKPAAKKEVKSTTKKVAAAKPKPKSAKKTTASPKLKLPKTLRKTAAPKPKAMKKPAATKKK